MDIRGLDLAEISFKLEKYVTDYFRDCQLTKPGQNLFAESYLFDFDEIKHLIPEEHLRLFQSTDKLNGASGFIEFDSMRDEVVNHEYIIMLLTDEDYTKAYLLCLQKVNNATNEEKTVILQNFLCT